jgi:hypothetical protein
MLLSVQRLFRFLPAITFIMASAASANTNVGVELALLVDVSGSISASDFNLQRQGYVNAFQSAAVQAAVTNSQTGGIAATLIYWAGAGQQQQAVGWTLINDAASANSFAATIAGAVRPFDGDTAPGSAIAFATPLFGSNTFDGLRQVIDVSGDGARNSGMPASTARNAALAAGIDQVNGVVILGEAGVQSFYENNIKGGAGSFIVVANDFGAFAQAIQGKLVAEINGVPEPSSMILMITLIGGLGFASRRRIMKIR